MSCGTSGASFHGSSYAAASANQRLCFCPNLTLKPKVWTGGWVFFLLNYQMYPWNPLNAYSNHTAPSIYCESLPRASSKDNGALITARLTLLNCALEQKSTWGKHSLWHINMEKLHSAPRLGLLRGSLSSCSVSQMGVLLLFFFLVALLLGERGSLVARYQTVYDLLEQLVKKHIYFPFYKWLWKNCGFLQGTVFFRLDFR